MSTDATLDLLKQALARAADPAALAKATGTFTQPSVATQGLQIYNLEAPAKNLYPVLSPIRNATPRVKATGGIQANWKAVTGINTTNTSIGVQEGQRGGLISVSTEEFYAAFRTIGLESSVTEEAELSAEGFDDLRARAANSGLQSLMIDEEKVLLGGVAMTGLGTTPTPTLTAATTGGTIAASTALSVICVAITMEGMTYVNPITGVPATVTRNNQDGTTTTVNGGAARRSSNATITTGSGTSTNSITATVAPVQGAAGYAWYIGAAGSEYFYGTTNFSQVTFTSLASTTATSAGLTGDNSKNPLIFDGLLGLNVNPLSNAYWFGQTPGSGLTPDGYGGVAEFEVVLKWYYDTLRAVPSKIWVSSQEIQLIRKKFLSATTGGQPSRFLFNIQQGSITGGGIPKGYLNIFGGGSAEIPIETHPYMPPGTIIFTLDKVPYPQNNIDQVMRVLFRRDYFQREWPQVTRSYQYGVYSDEVLQHYFPVSIAVISNLAPV